MADDNKQDTPDTGADQGQQQQQAQQPSFDYDAIASQVASKLKDEFKQAVPPPPAQPQPQQPQPAMDPVEELVSPYTKRAEARAALAEAAATDAAIFYVNNPDITKEDRQVIEERFKVLHARGIPFTREDIYKHLLGERIDQEVEKRIERREKKLREAELAAASVGHGSPDKVNATTIRDPHAMSTADLEKALQGTMF